MTEEEWLASIDSAAMLAYLRGGVSDRKLHLWVEACRAEFNLLHPVAENALWPDLSEEPPTSNAVAWMSHNFDYPPPMPRRAALLRDIFGNPWRSYRTLHAGTVVLPGPSWDGSDVHYLHGEWLTPTVVQIARGIYDERAFGRMPVLADALEEAGCTEEAVLRHCRTDAECSCCGHRWSDPWGCWWCGALLSRPAPHVRGCHVLDLFLGQS